MHTPATLAALRSAILHQQQVTFSYEGFVLTADLYLLGLERSTGDYLVLAWIDRPEPKWVRLRCSLIENFKVSGRIETFRQDFNPYDKLIATIDTYLAIPRNRASSD